MSAASCQPTCLAPFKFELIGRSSASVALPPRGCLQLVGASGKAAFENNRQSGGARLGEAGVGPSQEREGQRRNAPTRISSQHPVSVGWRTLPPPPSP